MKRFVVMLVAVFFTFVAAGSYAAEGKPEAQKDAAGVAGSPATNQKDAGAIAGEQKNSEIKKTTKKKHKNKKKHTSKKKKHTSKKKAAEKE